MCCFKEPEAIGLTFIQRNGISDSTSSNGQQNGDNPRIFTPYP